MKSAIVPCIWLDDQAEAAAAAYVEIFPFSRVSAISHYPTHADNPSGKPRGSVLTVELELAQQRFTLLNGGPMFKPSPAVSFFVQVDTAPEADRVFHALADGGQVLMPIDRYPWSERYGWVQDRFGVSWQVMFTAPGAFGEATIVPCLMFANERHGKAEEAMRFYAGALPGSEVETIDRYGEGEGDPRAAGTVKHGRFVLAGQPMTAMDSHGVHGFGFDEGVSLQVMCDDQAAVDRTWDALVAGGGSPGPCGWLKDRYGLSWQVVPSAIRYWMDGKDPAGRDRAFAAVMTMSKLDIATIDRAYHGA